MGEVAQKPANGAAPTDEALVSGSNRSRQQQPACCFPSPGRSQLDEAEALQTVRDALRDAMAEEMRRDDSVFLMGEEVAEYQGAYKVSQGLLQEFGARRVIDTPISEHAIAGIGVGAAYAGLKPIVEFMTWNFAMQAMDQIINSAAKTRYMSGGQMSTPIVFRGPNGIASRVAAQHSQCFASWFAHVPGLKVVAPSTPYDAKGCLIQSIRDDNPVIFVDHRMLHPQKGHVPESDYAVPFGKARVAVTGGDVTLVGISYMFLECLRAGRLLEDAGISAEVIDPVSLSPLDTDTILQSVLKTGRLLVVDTGWTSCGASAEIVARVAESLPDARAAQLRRMGFEPVTCPTTRNLEDLFYPNAQRIARMAHGLVRDGDDSWMPPAMEAPEIVQFKGPF